MQSEFFSWQNSVMGQELPYIVYQPIQPRRRPKIVQSLVGLRWVTSQQKRSQDAKQVKICCGAPNW